MLPIPVYVKKKPNQFNKLTLYWCMEITKLHTIPSMFNLVYSRSQTNLKSETNLKSIVAVVILARD